MDWIYRLESQRREDCWMDERERLERDRYELLLFMYICVVYMGLTGNNVL